MQHQKSINAGKGAATSATETGDLSSGYQVGENGFTKSYISETSGHLDGW